MKIILLGTGTPAVDLKGVKACASEVVVIGKDNLLFDCGRWVSWQLVRSEVKPWDINYLFFTHVWHFDHTCDYHTLAFSRVGGPHQTTKTLHVYGPKDGEQGGLGTTKFSEMLFREVFRGDARAERALKNMDIKDVGEGLVCETESWRVTAVNTSHIGPHGEPSLAYRIDSKEGSVVISGDITVASDEANAKTPYKNRERAYASNPSLKELAKGADVQIMDADVAHTTPEDLGRAAQEANVKIAILTHIQNPGKIPKHDLTQVGYDKLRSRIRKFFKGEIVIGEDLMTILILPENQRHKPR